MMEDVMASTVLQLKAIIRAFSILEKDQQSIDALVKAQVEIVAHLKELGYYTDDYR